MSNPPLCPSARLRPALATAGGAVLWAAALVLGGSPLAATAQTLAPPPSPASADSQRWRQANEAVGRYPRGHADVLQAEGTTPLPSHRPELPPLPSPQSLLRQGLMERPDLWAQPSDNALQLQQRRQALAGWSRDLLHAWWQAAAAAQDALLAADQHESARLGAELAQRMAHVGNWSEAKRLAQQRLALVAEQEAGQSLVAAAQSRLDLLRLLRRSAPPPQTDLPEPGAAQTPAAPIDWGALPPAPEAAALQAALDGLTQRADWQVLYARWQQARRAVPDGPWLHAQRALSALVQAVAPPDGHVWTQPPQWPPGQPAVPHRVEQLWHAQAELQALTSRWQQQTHAAWQRLQEAHRALAHALQQSVPTAQATLEETQRRVNGMLLSTWDLLAAQREHIQAQRAAVRARLSWELAWADWQALQAGAAPALHALTSTPSAPAGTSEQGH